MLCGVRRTERKRVTRADPPNRGPGAARRALAALLAGLALSLGGCDAPGPDALRFGVASAPESLDPRFATDAVSTRVNRLLYARLTDFDTRFRPQPALARWERLSPTRYRFHLRPGRSPFHDGTALTAADVAATYRSVLEPATGSPHRGSLHMLRAVRAVDEDTVDFLLATPDALFPGRLAIGILPARRLAAGHDFGAEPVGSGPFRFDAWTGPEQLRIVRVRDGAAVRFERVRKPDVRVLKLLRGELDAIQGDLPPELLGWLAPRDEIELHRREGTTFAYLGFHLGDPVTGDLRVRRAVAHAIDREAIIRHLWAGHARPAAGILPPDHWAGHRAPSPPAHDPDAARRLLREAGYGPARPARMVYKTSTNPLRVRIATVIQHQLAAVGIELDIRSYDWGTFYGDIKAGNFQLYSLAWVGIKMPDIFRYVFHSDSVPPAGANRGRWRDARVDELIERAEAAQDPAEQARLYRQVQAHALEQLPYVPLWFEDQVFAARAGVRGYTLSRDGDYDGLAEARWTRAGPGAP